MDYFKQRRAYRQWKQNEGSIARGQNDVYRELLDYANDEGRLDEFFKLRNSALVDWTGLTLQGVIKARNGLVDLGLLDYRPGIKNKSTPKYKIIPLYYTNTPQSVHQEYNNQFTNRITAGSPTVEQPVEHKDLLVLDKDLNNKSIYTVPANTQPPARSETDVTDFTELVNEYSHQIRQATGISKDARQTYIDAVLLGETTKQQVLDKIREYHQWCDLNDRQIGYRKGATRWFEEHGWLTEYDLSKPTEKPTGNSSRPTRKEPVPEWAKPDYKAPSGEMSAEGKAAIAEAKARLKGGRG